MHDWEVVVSNVGTVYSGRDEDEARKRFRDYVNDSEAGYGRVGGENVVLFCDGDIKAEHNGSNPTE